MLEENLQAGIDSRDDVLVRDLCEHIKSETYPSYRTAFQVLQKHKRRVATYWTTRTLTLRNVFTNMS